MPNTIDFCIPFVASGIRYLEYLINNIERTASHPDRINMIVSYHTDNDLDVLKKSPVYSMIKQTVMAPAFSTQILFFPSANHASAINTLSKASTADIVIFCDYDMAFVYPGWDKLIEDYMFIDHKQICGVTYPCLWIPFQNQHVEELMPALKNTPLAKYQNLPNLSFFAISGATLKNTFASRLTHFDEFLAEGGLPFRLINTPALAAENNLPLGAMQWLDTGCELPGMIQQKNIPYATFPYVMLDQQTVLPNSAGYEQLPVILRPEVFYCQKENVPFLCHFKKGTAKSGIGDIDTAFKKFTSAVDSFLKK
jgi:hypothetical protein